MDARDNPGSTRVRGDVASGPRGAARLAQVHLGVGQALEGVGLQAVLRIARDTRGRGGAAADRGERPVADALPVLSRADDRELVAAEAGDGVVRAVARAQLVGDPAQELVAGGVPVAVVDRLEVVEVDDNEAEPPVVALRVP